MEAEELCLRGGRVWAHSPRSSQRQWWDGDVPTCL